MTRYSLNTSYDLIKEFKQNYPINENVSIEYFTDPYHHVVISNIFKSEVYEEICDIFPALIAKCSGPYGKSKNATSQYEAYIASINLKDCTNNHYLSILISDYLKKFLSNLFNIQTNQYIASSAHWHMAPSKSGFIHRDFAVCSFKSSSNIMMSDQYEYTDDSDTNDESIVKTMRSLVFLYYLNNPSNLDDYIGGGTGIYTNFNSTLIKEVRPRNNSLLAFEITPKSYHAYVGANFNRSAIVQWYHSSPAYLLNRHWHDVIEFYKKNNRILDTWRARDSYWKFEKDPDYNLYFNTTIEQSLNKNI